MAIADIQTWSFSEAQDYITNNSMRALSTEFRAAPEACKKIATLFSERILTTSLNPIPQSLALRAAAVIVPYLDDEMDRPDLSTLINYIQDIKDEVVNTAEEDSMGNTLLHSAAYLGKEGIINRLIEKEADIHKKNETGVTPLHISVFGGKVGGLRVLLNNGARINEKTSDEGGTALHIAAAAGQIECLKELLLNGADFSIRGAEGVTPIHLAARSGNTECLKELLLKGANIEETDDEGHTPLYYAAMADDSGCFVELLQRGAKFDIKCKKGGHTLLHVVAASGNTENVLELLKKGVLIDEKDAEGCTPLHYALKNEQILTALELIKNGASLFTLDKENQSPLSVCDTNFLIVLKSHFTPQMQEVITLINAIEKNQEDEYISDDLPTLLLYAYSIPEVARLLIQKGAYSFNNYQIHHLVEKLTPKEKEKYLLVLNPQEQVALLNPLTQEEKDKLISGVLQTPHLSASEWLQQYRKNRDILPFSLPSQIQSLEPYDILAPEFTTLKEKLDSIEQSLQQEMTLDNFNSVALQIDSCNISFLQHKQLRYDRKVSYALKNPKLEEQRVAYKAREDLKNQTLDSIKNQLQKIKDTFDPIRKRFEADLPAEYVDPVWKELMSPDDCWCDPTTENKQMCSKSAFGEGRSPYTGLPVNKEEVVQAPASFIETLKKLQEAKAQGIDVLNSVIKDLSRN